MYDNQLFKRKHPDVMLGFFFSSVKTSRSCGSVHYKSIRKSGKLEQAFYMIEAKIQSHEVYTSSEQ
jgi:hypothetical protein